VTVLGILIFELLNARRGGKHYEAIECAACRGIHFVNISTLKLLSEDIPD
jgi:hypothetical protein